MRFEAPLIGALLCLSFPQATAARAGDFRIDAAVAARDAGHAQEAIKLLEALLQDRPNDPTILRLLGTSYAAAGRYDDAAIVLTHAQAAAPKDQDIALARARVALWSKRSDEASSIVEQIAAVEPNNPEILELREAIRAAQTPKATFRLTSGIGVSRVFVGGITRTWKEAALSLDTRIGQQATMAVGIEHSDRFDATDTRLSVQVDRKLGSHVSAFLGGNSTPGADFRERWSLRGGGEAKLRDVFALTFNARYAVYRAGGVTAAEPGVRFQSRHGRLAVSARLINLWDEQGKHRSGWSGRTDFVASDNLRLLAGAASYPDTEAGTTRQVDAFFVGAGVSLTRGLDLQISVDREKRADSYRRSGLTIGLRWQPKR
jgi:YaiO family outer membrane protein